MTNNVSTSLPQDLAGLGNTAMSPPAGAVPTDDTVGSPPQNSSNAMGASGKNAGGFSGADLGVDIKSQ